MSERDNDRRTDEERERARRFGAWLQGQIERRGMSRSGFAKRADVPRTSINDYVAGVSSPREGVIQRLAEALDLPQNEVRRQVGLLALADPDADRSMSRERRRLEELARGIPESRVVPAVQILEALVRMEEE